MINKMINKMIKSAAAPWLSYFHSDAAPLSSPACFLLVCFSSIGGFFTASAFVFFFSVLATFR